jgi:hypothetical protein
MKAPIINKYIRLSLLGAFTIFCSGCDKYLTLDPPVDQLTTELVFNNDDAVKSTITGIYGRMILSDFASGSASSITNWAALSADELINYSNTNTPFYTNALASGNIGPWNQSYQMIYTANAILEGIENNSRISTAVKQQAEGEAKFIRAFCYFYLTNFYGKVPLHLSTDYRLNNIALQANEAAVYRQIIKDLLDAQSLLGTSYYTTERVRPNKWVATALLARVYLYTKDYVNAEILSNSIIENKPTYSLNDDLSQVFLKNSTEAIWQLIPNTAGRNTNEAQLFIFTATPTVVSISEDLMAAFEAGDKRRTSWTGSTTVSGKTYYYPFKYKVGNVAALTEYSMVLRLAEQYLIRAEARIHLDKIDLGVMDLNTLRLRARAAVTGSVPNPLPPIPNGLLKPAALLAVERERRIELFTEWGHRWLDLKRTNRADAVLAPIKGSNWQPTDALYPIPQAEINSNPNIIQNKDY